MRLLEFVHEEKPAANRKLFGFIGEFCACDKIREDLGGNISSEPGRVWIVGVEKQTVAGFASLRNRRSGVFLMHLFGIAEGAELLLLEQAITRARELGGKVLVTTDYTVRKDIYAELGFKAGDERGRFIRLEKVL